GAGSTTEEAPGFFAPGTIYMACGEGGYVGLTRLEDGRLDVAAALSPAHVRRASGLAGASAHILDATDWPSLAELGRLSWRGTPALSRQARCPAGRRYFVVGDAAGYIEPFTGEGMAWALASAVALAPLVVRAAEHWRPEMIGHWRRRLDFLLGDR